MNRDQYVELVRDALTTARVRDLTQAEYKEALEEIIDEVNSHYQALLDEME